MSFLAVPSSLLWPEAFILQYLVDEQGEDNGISLLVSDKFLKFWIRFSAVGLSLVEDCGDGASLRVRYLG